MKLKRVKIIMLLIMLFSTYNVYAAETGSIESSAQTPQVVEVLNKNRTILMGVDLGGSANVLQTNLHYHIARPMVQLGLSYRYYFYANKMPDKIKNGLCLDFGTMSSIQTDTKNPSIDKSSAWYFTSSVLYSLNSYGVSVYHNFLFNIGLNANFFLKKLKTVTANKPGYSYNFAQVGILMEIGYLVYTPGFKTAFIFKLIFKGLTNDISPHYPYQSFMYIGFSMSLLFNSN